MTYVLVALFFLAGFGSLPARADDVSGRAEVIDGDTIAVAGVRARIRLWGVDAPEGRQACADGAGRRYLCGSRAAEALADLIGRNGRVTCRERDRDRYRRIVAVCEAAGRDVAGEMVRLGWAVDYPAYSGGAYAAQEAQARAARRGLWGGAFVPPWEWRAGGRLAAAPEGEGP